MSYREYEWWMKLPDGSEHKFYVGPEETNPLASVSGFEQGDYYLIQCPGLVDKSGIPCHDYIIPLGSGPELPEWVSDSEPYCGYVHKDDVIEVSGFDALP